jgi:hypothetical protein
LPIEPPKQGVPPDIRYPAEAADLSNRLLQAASKRRRSSSATAKNKRHRGAAYLDQVEETQFFF